MSDLYPLRLHPEFYERVWGARNLAPVYSREITGNPIGEAWLTGDDTACAIERQAGRKRAGGLRPAGRADATRRAERQPVRLPPVRAAGVEGRDLQLRRHVQGRVHRRDPTFSVLGGEGEAEASWGAWRSRDRAVARVETDTRG